MLTQLERNMIASTHKLNLNSLILESIDALELNRKYMKWGIFYYETYD